MKYRILVYGIVTLSLGGMFLDAAADTQTEALFKAIQEKNSKMVKLLIEDGVDVNSFDNEYTALSLAARSGNVEIAKMLLAHGAKVSSFPSHATPPIVAAASNKDIGMLKLMVGQGADVNASLGDTKVQMKWVTTSPGTTALSPRKC